MIILPFQFILSSVKQLKGDSSMKKTKKLKFKRKIYTQGSYAPDDNIILEDAAVDNISKFPK